MALYQVEGGFINLGEYRIAIAAIEAVQFVAKKDKQDGATSPLKLPKSEFRLLHVRVLLKSGNAIGASIRCVAENHSATDPVHVRLMSCQAVEEVIRVATRLEDVSVLEVLKMLA